MRLLLLALSLQLALPTLAQDGAEADRALVRQVYAAVERGDVPAVLAVLDEHVFWVEDATGIAAGHYIGPGTVEALVLQPQRARKALDVPESITSEGDKVVVVGTTRWTDPATGRTGAVPFRHVWRVVDGRVTSVERSVDSAAGSHDAEPHGSDL